MKADQLETEPFTPMADARRFVIVETEWDYMPERFQPYDPSWRETLGQPRSMLDVPPNSVLHDMVSDCDILLEREEALAEIAKANRAVCSVDEHGNLSVEDDEVWEVLIELGEEPASVTYCANAYPNRNGTLSRTTETTCRIVIPTDEEKQRLGGMSLQAAE